MVRCVRLRRRHRDELRTFCVDCSLERTAFVAPSIPRVRARLDRHTGRLGRSLYEGGVRRGGAWSASSCSVCVSSSQSADRALNSSSSMASSVIPGGSATSGLSVTGATPRAARSSTLILPSQNGGVCTERSARTTASFATPRERHGERLARVRGATMSRARACPTGIDALVEPISVKANACAGCSASARNIFYRRRWRRH